MIGMSYMSGSKSARNVASLGFTSQGGNKKAGLWTGQPFMRVYNIGNHYTYRIPQTQPTIEFSLWNTTRSPVQWKRNGYYSNPLM